MFKFFFLLNFFFIYTVSQEKKQKISDINVLLPICFSKLCNKVYYSVYAYGGCYEWSTDDNYLNIEQIRLNDDKVGCYSKVVISAKDRTNGYTYLIAKDKKSNEQFRCRVGFERIFKLLIAKRFDKMNIGDVFEIDVLGYDDKDNSFSTLEGFRFHWKFSDNSKVEQLKLENEKIEAGDRRLRLDESDIILLKGLKTGKVGITAIIQEEDYKELTSDTRFIYIVQPFTIYPENPVYILPKSYFNFDIKLLTTGLIISQEERINYSWRTKKECGFIQGFGKFNADEFPCDTEIVASDNRIEDFNYASTMIYVENPTSVDIGIIEIESDKALLLSGNKDIFEKFIDGKNFEYKSTWKLVEGKYYIIKNVLLFERNIIYDHDEIYYETLSKVTGLEFKFCYKTKKMCLIYASQITNDFQEIYSSTDLYSDLNVKKGVKVFSRVKIENFGKNKFLLPYLGYSNRTSESLNSQELKLIVSGGTESYHFKSADYEIILIKDQVLYGLNRGSTLVTVNDAEIPSNFDSILIEVLDIKDITYMEERQEVEIGERFEVSHIALNDQNELFTNCTNLNIMINPNFQSKNIKYLELNYDVSTYLKVNNDLTKQKLKFLDIEDNDNLNYRYHNYIKFGVCSIKSFLPEAEGMFKLSFLNNILDKKKNIERTLISSNHARIFVYTDMTLISPRFEDIFTKELIARSNIMTDSIILAPKSGITVKFTGGISMWNGYNEDYLENIYIYEHAKNRTYSFDNIKEDIKLKGSNKEFYFECLSDNFELEVVIDITNKYSKTLLRPKKTKYSFTLGCYYPNTLSIFIVGNNTISSQKNDISNEIFNIPQNAGIEYYEKMNTMDVLRVYAFDENKRIIYNITSVKGDWIPNNAFILKPNENGDKFIDLSSKYPEYIHSNVLFANYTARFNMKYETMKKIKSHFVTINLIDFPYLSPSNTTLFYLYSNYLDINIIKGSGEFTYSLSDNSLVKDSYTNRVIRLYPKREGLLVLKLRDKKINVDFETEAYIYISQIKRIELIGGGLLMVNKKINLKIAVYDSYDRQFTTSQIEKMNIVINNLSSLSGKLEAVFKDLNTINVIGLEAGHYSLSVYETHNNIISNSIAIEVFSRIEVFPPKLLMYPGSKYTLSIKGGPIKQEFLVKTYLMEDSKIASVAEKEPEITAHIIGSTVCKLVISIRSDYNKVYNNDDYIKQEDIELTVINVPVIVEFPDSVDIMNSLNRIIYTGSTVRVLAALKKDAETFTYGIGQINHQWSIDNSLIAKIRISQECKQDRDICMRREINTHNTVGIFIKTLREGDLLVTVTIQINYPEPYINKKPNSFSRTEKIKISDKIFLEMSEFYEYDPNKSGLYLLPPSIEHEMHINKDNNEVKYSQVQNSDLINISERGRITTYEKRGLTNVIIDRNEKVSNRPFVPVIVPIYVVDFHSLFVEKSYHLIDMEVGQNAIHKIILQHEFGLLFAEKLEKLPLRAVESDPKVVKVELIEYNGKIKIYASGRGETNIIVFNPENMKIYDVLKITVFSTLRMLDVIRINIGGKINFLNKDLKRKEFLTTNSEWFCDNPDVLKINNDGTSIALKEGVAKVYLLSNDKKQEKVSIKVIVSRVKAATLDNIYTPKYITDIKSNKNYKNIYILPIKVYTDAEGTEFTSNDEDPLNTIEQNIHINCVSLNPEIFVLQTETENERKLCKLILRENINYEIEPPQTLDMRLVVESRGEGDDEKYNYETLIKFPFTSSFKIKHDIKEINFYKNNRTNYVYVSNMNDIDVILENQNFVQSEVHNEAGNNYVKLYVPHNITEDFQDIKLSLVNKITNQKHDISLNYFTEREVEKKFLGISRGNLIDLFTLIFLICTIAVLYNYITNEKEKVTYPQESYSRPPMGSFSRSNTNIINRK